MTFLPPALLCILHLALCSIFGARVLFPRLAYWVNGILDCADRRRKSDKRRRVRS